MNTTRKEFHDVATGESIPQGNGGWEDMPERKTDIDEKGVARAHNRHRDNDER